ncbi:MFS transporter [Sinorhizobium numidicum]|uniref:MFS transporter n=1 Tax=Sinorhizobium numidicum TaxID=680248 RepID=A0ABY8CYU0_9HYPH|nr:MFS transporter [Sinorhizobium numidicum]WEX75948.1 MFS transporter [Sinorhizobium numidicum]WEX82607.1 MFS transporter [Sinorhizobium numidicum]
MTEKSLGDNPAPGVLSAGNRGRNLTLLCVSALTIMSGATISASLPGMETHFAGMEGVALLSRLMLTLPAIFIAMLAPIAGVIADRFGRKRLLLSSLILFALAGSSGLVLDGLPGLLVGRAVLGVSVAGIMTAATAVVGDFFEGAARERYVGFQAAFVGIGGTIFLTGGGLLADIHWRAPFAIYCLAFALLPAALALIPEPLKPKITPAAHVDQSDFRGAALPLVLLLFAAGLHFAMFYMLPTQLPFYLKSLGFAQPSQAGAAIGLAQAVGVAAALTFARMRERIGRMAVFALGFAALSAGYWGLGTVESYAGILAATAITGVSMGVMTPNLSATLLAIAPPALRGRLSGALIASIFAGQFLSPLVSQPLIRVWGYAATFSAAGALLAALAVACLASRTLAVMRPREDAVS